MTDWRDIVELIKRKAGVSARRTCIFSISPAQPRHKQYENGDRLKRCDAFHNSGGQRMSAFV